MIRIVVVAPDSNEPEVVTVHSLADLHSLLGGEAVSSRSVRTLPDGYDLCALWNSQVRARPNMTLEGTALYGTVAFAVYDDTVNAYIDPARVAQRAIVAIARVLLRSRAAVASQ